jgi:hypothetical protein
LIILSHRKHASFSGLLLTQGGLADGFVASMMIKSPAANRSAVPTPQQMPKKPTAAAAQQMFAKYAVSSILARMSHHSHCNSSKLCYEPLL